MTTPRSTLLRGQFDLTWALFTYHLERLRDDDFLWEPGPRCWTMRQDAAGTWVPDFAETEPDPVPVPTIAWLTWHIGWRWSGTLDHAYGRAPRDHTEMAWPGPGEPAVARLRDLRTQWLEWLDTLDDATLDAPAGFPHAEPGHTVAAMAGWANAELMKNVAEIGQLRLLRAAESG